MRSQRAAARLIQMAALIASGCWQNDRLLGYVATAAHDDARDGDLTDGPPDSITESEASPCIDPRVYPGGGLFKADIADGSGMTLNGDAASTDGVLRLANATLEISSGSAFFTDPVSFGAGTSLFAHFAFRIGGGQGEAGADGMAFVVQSSPAGASALGMSGEKLGYGPIAPSVAIEIDTWHNDTDPAGQHVALLAGGDTTQHIESASVPFSFNDGVVRYMWVDYDGKSDTLEVYLSPDNARPSTALLTHTGFDFSGALGSTVYIGFSAATGGSRNDHDVLGEAWFFTSPLPKCR
jgi:hypothetical protein